MRASIITLRLVVHKSFVFTLNTQLGWLSDDHWDWERERGESVAMGRMAFFTIKVDLNGTFSSPSCVEDIRANDRRDKKGLPRELGNRSRRSLAKPQTHWEDILKIYDTAKPTSQKPKKRRASPWLRQWNRDSSKERKKERRLQTPFAAISYQERRDQWRRSKLSTVNHTLQEYRSRRDYIIVIILKLSMDIFIDRRSLYVSVQLIILCRGMENVQNSRKRFAGIRLHFWPAEHKIQLLDETGNKAKAAGAATAATAASVAAVAITATAAVTLHSAMVAAGQGDAEKNVGSW